MFKWRYGNFVIVLSLILGSGALVALTPGWKATLAEASKYGYGTSMWFYNYSWTNGPVGFTSPPVYYNQCFNYSVARQVCPGGGFKSAYVEFPPWGGHVLKVTCSVNSQVDLSLTTRGITWELVWKQQSPASSYVSPIITESECVQKATAKSYCASRGTTGEPSYHFRTPGPHLDVSCPISANNQ